MKSRNLKTLLATITVLFLFTCMQVQAQPVQHEGRGKEARRHNFLRSLNLTEDQKAKIADLGAKNQKDMIDLKSDVEKLQIDKREFIRKCNIDRKSFVDLESKIMNLQNKMHLAGLNHKLDVYELLTPEQKEKTKVIGFWHGRHEEMKAKMQHKPEQSKKNVK